MSPVDSEGKYKPEKPTSADAVSLSDTQKLVLGIVRGGNGKPVLSGEIRKQAERTTGVSITNAVITNAVRQVNEKVGTQLITPPGKGNKGAGYKDALSELTNTED